MDVFTFDKLYEIDTECCGTSTDDFEISMNGEELCNECSNNIWEIIK